MAKQRLFILVLSLFLIIIFAGVISASYFSELTSSSSDTSSQTDTSSSLNDDTSDTIETISSGNSISDLSDITQITLNIDSINVDNQKNTIIQGTKITITHAGTYNISGTLNDGQILVDTNDQESVELILNGVSISSTTVSPIHIENADQAIIVLAEGTENHLEDTINNSNNATLFSKDDLTIKGEGTLTLQANDKDGIRCNDDLIIESGNLIVTSVDDGIRGKDYLEIKNGEITINSGGDGLKSDNDEDPTKGNIYIQAGKITITATHGDAIFAQTSLSIDAGTFSLITGGGSNSHIDESTSSKALKAGVSIVINDGAFFINSLDDSIHSNDEITINGGTFTISSGDDGIHADLSIEINNGTFDITKSFEGIESEIVSINNGFIQIISSDDGINLVDSTQSSPTNIGGRPGGFGGPGGDTPSENCILYINGGFIAIDSGGDGVDSNGYIEMSNGVLIINGPTSNMNAAIDYGGGSFTLTGGTLVAVGSAGMAQAPSTSSTQYYANIRFGSTQSANTIVNIQTTSGEDVLTFYPTKPYQSLVFSSSELEAGTYNVYVGGSFTGTSTCGLYEDGTYSGGTMLGSFTIS